MQERGEKMQERKEEMQERKENVQERKEEVQQKTKKIYPFGCNINYFSYICTRKGIIILNVYL